LKQNKIRLDIELVERGLAESRQRAQGLILAGHVLVDGQKAEKAGTMVGASSEIRLIGEDIPYVSRGGLKLRAALDVFGLDVTGLVCADVGASTGGFTDCLLQAGAAKVYAVDVGYGLLDLKVRDDPRVVVIERTNARNLTPEMIGEPVDIAVVDVSFISLKLVLGPAKGIIRPGGRLIALVKPQFEVGRGKVGKGGIVRDEADRQAALAAVEEFAAGLGMEVLGDMESPIKGAKGNIEYLVYLKV
jgi:23S rRNA (cytidine1920-2'-O)/16S rRNA (cytidine1409-2'-O)-methyltransferase